MKKILIIFIGFSKVFLVVFKLGDFVFSHQGVHYFPVKRPTSRLIVHKCCVNLCESLWIFVDLCGSLWIFVDLCGIFFKKYHTRGLSSIVAISSAKKNRNFYSVAVLQEKWCSLSNSACSTRNTRKK